MKLSKFTYSFQIRKSIYHQLRQHWQDILIVVVLAAAAGFASYQGAQLINPALTLDKQATDAWFNNDTTRTFDDMAVYEADHYRSNLHPLFVVLVLPVVYALKTVLLVEPITAVRIVIAVVASLWFSLLFILLRLIGCRQFDAILFSILAASSAAAMFWFVIPETYPFGSLSMLLGLVLVALATKYRKPSQLWYVLVSALTLGFTVTNWMTGILATIVNHRPKQSLQITLKAFSLVAVLVVVQKIIFPAFNAGFLYLFLTAHEEASSTGVLRPDYGGPMTIIKCFVFDTMVMPSINLLDNKFPAFSKLSVQMSSPGSASVWGAIAVVLWIALLSLGLRGLFSVKQHQQLRIVLGLSLLGQLALEIVYGDERFVHSIHFLPFLVVLAALSTLTRARLLALVLAGTLVLSAGANNILQFNQAVAFTNGYGPLCAMPSAKCAVDGKIIPNP
jgi:hypothetical protein